MLVVRRRGNIAGTGGGCQGQGGDYRGIVCISSCLSVMLNILEFCVRVERLWWRIAFRQRRVGTL